MYKYMYKYMYKANICKLKVAGEKKSIPSYLYRKCCICLQRCVHKTDVVFNVSLNTSVFNKRLADYIKKKQCTLSPRTSLGFLQMY